MWVMYRADLELFYGPLWQHRLRQHLDHQLAIVERLSVRRPVLVTLDLWKDDNLEINLEVILEVSLEVNREVSLEVNIKVNQRPVV